MLSWIMAFVELCNQAIAAGRTVQKISEFVLSHREKELLRVAHHDGLIHLLQSDASGRYVSIGNREFTDEDPAITAHYLDAFTRLCERGLIVHQSEELFRLTGQGFDIARKLAK